MLKCVYLLLLSATTIADSEPFYLEVFGGDTAIGQTLSLENSTLVINDQQGIQAVVTETGQLKFQGNQFAAVGRRSQMIVTDREDLSSGGFAIRNGFLVYAPGFYVKQVDDDLLLYLGVTDGHSTPIVLKAVGAGGTPVPDYPPFLASAAISSSTLVNQTAVTKNMALKNVAYGYFMGLAALLL